MPVVVPPTPQICAVCNLLDVAIEKFLIARRDATAYARFESSVEAINLFNLVLRSVESTLVLARTDLVLLPGAQATARAACEVSTKAAWMVDTNSSFAREVRWLSHIQEEERVYERTAKLAKHDARSLLSQAEELRAFRVAVQEKLPAGTAVATHNANMAEMLESLGHSHMYRHYIRLSQFVHGGHMATWLYRAGGVGTEKRIGEFIASTDWELPLRTCWWALHENGSRMLWRLGHRARSFMPQGAIDAAEAALEELS